jgi:hypothetical protein
MTRRLTEILILKLDPGELDETTQARGAEGIIAYSAICAHAACLVSEWVKAEQGDRIGNEGANFMDYVAMQSCTSGRNAFFTGMYPLRTGMIPPQLPGSPSYLRLGTPALAQFLLDLGYNTGEFGKNHLGDHTDALPTAHGFQELLGLSLPPRCSK